MERWLQIICEDMGMSCNRFCEDVGISSKVLNKPIDRLSTGTLKRLAKYMGLTLDKFVQRYGD